LDFIFLVEKQSEKSEESVLLSQVKPQKNQFLGLLMMRKRKRKEFVFF
jgi:hypothetical protein